MNLLYLFQAMPLPIIALTLPLAGVAFMLLAMIYGRFAAKSLGRACVPKIWYKLPLLVILLAELVLSYKVWAGVAVSSSPFYLLSDDGWRAVAAGVKLNVA